MPTVLEEIRDLFNYSVRHKGGLLNALLMKNEAGQIYYSALFCVYLLPVLIVYGFYRLMMIPFDAEPGTVERTLELEERNRYEKAKIEHWI